MDYDATRLSMVKLLKNKEMFTQNSKILKIVLSTAFVVLLMSGQIALYGEFSLHIQIKNDSTFEVSMTLEVVSPDFDPYIRSDFSYDTVKLGPYAPNTSNSVIVPGLKGPRSIPQFILKGKDDKDGPLQQNSVSLDNLPYYRPREGEVKFSGGKIHAMIYFDGVEGDNYLYRIVIEPVK